MLDPLTAIAYWFTLQLDERTTLSTRPPSSVSASRHQAVRYLGQEIELRPGDLLRLRVGHDTQQLRVALLEPPVRPRSVRGARPSVPAWHFAMLADSERNAAYQRAIDKAVARVPNAHVLDLGTGTGLLAMMASRAGAGRVTACEMLPHLADLASDVIDTNGLTDAVRVFGQSSLALTAEQLGGRADILVSETFDFSLLGEGFLPALVHAHRELLVERPIVIPATASIHAVVVDVHVDRVAGVDLEWLNVLRLNHYSGIRLRRVEHARLSESFEAFRFDFGQPTFQPERKHFKVPMLRPGVCSGVAFWFELGLDDETTLATGPDSSQSGWEQAVVFFDPAIVVERGDVIRLVAEHDLRRVRFYPDPKADRELTRWPAARPDWALELSTDEQDLNFETEAMVRESASASRPAERLVEELAASAVDCALEPTLVSDFIKQLGRWACPERPTSRQDRLRGPIANITNQTCGAEVLTPKSP